MDETYVEQLATAYKGAKELADNSTKRVKILRDEIVVLVDADGVPDDKGHKWLTAGVHKIKYERRVSQTFDAAAAEQWAKSNGLWDDISTPVVALDEDKLLGLGWTNPQHSDTIKSFYKESISWALKV